MFVINEDGMEFITPWDIPLQERLKKIIKGKEKGYRVVCYLYEEADTSTFRYRVYNICSSLEYSKKYVGSYFFRNELELLSNYMHSMDIIVLGRFRWSNKLDRFISLAKTNNIKVAFEVDDMVYNTKYISKIMSTLSVIDTEDRYNYWFSYVARMASSLELADVAITTNKYLADFIKKDTGKDCYVIQNTYNYFQRKVSDNYYNQKKRQKSKEKFLIGYFSGTPSHINDFICVAPEILKFLDDHDDAVLRIVGFMEFPNDIKKYIDMGKIEFYPLTDFVKLQRYIAEVDVNIVPLVDNEFSSCKSELKFFEASIVGTVTCATPSYTFRQCIENGKNGFLCKTGEWYDTLQMIYENNNKKELKEIINKAKIYSEENYEYCNIVDVVDDVFDNVLGGK